jgi:integrase/recombinase XerD
MMIEKFVEEALRAKSELTKKTYKHSLMQFESWLVGAGADLANYCRADVQQYFDFLTARRKSPATVHKIYAAIRKFSIWAGKSSCVEELRIIKMSDNNQIAPKAMDRLLRNKILREVERESDFRNTAIVVTLLYTGLRVSELVNLNLQDIEMSERKGNLTVRMGKGYKSRVIPINSEVRRALANYMATRNSDEHALFLSNRGSRISIRSVQHLLGRFGVHPHQFRHSFITDLIRSNHDIAIVKALSGHSSLESLSKYSKPTEFDMINAVNDLYVR